MPLDPETPQNPSARWWQRNHFGPQELDAFKSALAAVLCLWLGRLLGLERSYWAAVSAIVVIGSDAGVTLTSSRDRIIGTAIGALLGWGTSYVWHGHALLYGLSVAVCILFCGALQFHKAGHLAAVALTIIVVSNLDSSPGRAALQRFFEVGLGILVALAVTLLVSSPKVTKTGIKPSVTNQ